jgi:hypothetical protein
VESCLILSFASMICIRADFSGEDILVTPPEGGLDPLHTIYSIRHLRGW